MKFKKLLIGLPLVATTMLPMMAISCKEPENNNQTNQIKEMKLILPPKFNSEIEKNKAIPDNLLAWIKEVLREARFIKTDKINLDRSTTGFVKENQEYYIATFKIYYENNNIKKIEGLDKLNLTKTKLSQKEFDTFEQI